MALEYLLGGAALSGVGSIAGGLIGSSATKKAIKEQNKILKGFLEEEKRRNALVEKNLDPFITTGHKALNTITGQGDPNQRLPSLIDQDFYGFQREEIERQTRRALSLRGNLYSGAGIEAENRAVANLAGETKRREQDLYLTLAQGGQNAAVQEGQIGASSLASAGNVASNIGNSIANLTATRGQQLASTVTGATGTIGGTLAGYGSNLQFQSFLRDVYQPAPAATLPTFRWDA